MSREEYVRNASQCMNLAAQMEDPNDRLRLLTMARAWLMLADYGFIFDDTARIVAAVTAPEAPQEE